MTGTTTPARTGAPSGRALENLIATYAFLVDDGEFAKLGDLLAEADFSLNGGRSLRAVTPSKGSPATPCAPTETARRAPGM